MVMVVESSVCCPMLVVSYQKPQGQFCALSAQRTELQRRRWSMNASPALKKMPQRNPCTKNVVL